MGCEEDDLKKLNDLIDVAIENERLKAIDLSNLNLNNNLSTDSLKDALDSIESCQVSPTPIFTKEQLDDISCIINSSLELPDQPDSLSLDSEESDDPTPEECEKKANQLNEELKIELKEYTDLNILMEKLIEYRDNYDVFTSYFSERAIEMARLTNKFQPVLEEIRRLESEIQILQEESNDLQVQISNSASYELREIYEAQKAEVDAEISELNVDLSAENNLLNTYTSEEEVISDSGITSILGDGGVSNSSLFDDAEFVLQIGESLSDLGYSQIKNSIENYSSVIGVNKVTVGSISNIVKSPIISFQLDFVGVNSIPIEEDVYNKETGERSTINVNFPIKNSVYLNKNSFFNPVSGVSVNNKPVNTNLSGDLYEKYYNKLEDPINNFFSLQERGLTSSEFLVDPKLKGTDFQVKRENSTDYYIQDLKKLQGFYEEFEARLNSKKEKVRKNQIKPSFEAASTNVKILARMDIKLLLALGRVNIDIIDESEDLRLIMYNIEESQKEFLKNSKFLNEEISRIKKRIKELKPSPEKIKKRLADLDMKCFEEKEAPENDSDLKNKVSSKEGNDPFGADTLKGVDPTMPSANDMKYWMQFSKVLNMVNLLPLPKDPSSLRYWPVGLVIPTPVKLIKIPLPIIWIPLTTLASPAGQTVIFLTINGLFISPVIFFSSSSGSKMHKITARGGTKSFGYDMSKVVKNNISFPLSIAAAKDKAVTSVKNPINELSKEDREKYNIKLDRLNKKLSTSTGNSKNKIQLKIDDLKKSISLETPSEVLKNTIDKKESKEDAIKDSLKSIYDRIDDLNEPEFKKCTEIQNKISNENKEIKKSLNKVYESKMPIKEKRKKIKELNEKLKKENISMDSKKAAIKEDMMDFFNKIKMPTLNLPKDKTKINPSLTPAESFKKASEEELTKYSYNTNSKNNKNVRKILLTNISKATDKIDLSNIPTNEKGLIEIEKNTGEIKKKLLEINTLLFNKVEGKPDPSLNEESLLINQKNLEKRISLENDNKKRKELKKELKEINASISDISDTKNIQEANSIDSKKLEKVSGFKINFSPFKSLTDMLPVELDLKTMPSQASLAFKSAKKIVDSNINDLNPSSLQNKLGGASEISPSALKELYFKTISEKVPKDINIPDDLNLQTVSSSSMGMLNSLSTKKVKIDLLSPFTLSKTLSLNLNIILKPLLDIIVSNMDEVCECLPVDVENNFKNLNSTDLKVNIKNAVANNIDKISYLFDAVYLAMSILRTTNGITLNKSDALSFLVPPFGGILLAKFIAEATLRMTSNKSLFTPFYDLKLAEESLKKIEPILKPIFDVPMSFIIPASSAMVNQQSTMRKLHPVMNADDIPPWERLSSKNFLFVLFLDEFITNAADKIGFFRRFI